MRGMRILKRDDREIPKSLGALANRLLRDVEFCREVKNRVEAADRLVNALPRSAQHFKKLLLTRPHRLSREVQYSLLNLLDGGATCGGVKTVFGVAQAYLNRLDSDAAFVAMKTGCMFGDGWFKVSDARWQSKIVTLLMLTLENGRTRASRGAALHGIKHLLNNIDVRRGKILLDRIKVAALTERSKHIRFKARRVLQDGWWGHRGDARVRAYARKLGKLL
jgi:hypothetical protein